MKRLVLLLLSCFLAFNAHSQDIIKSRKFEPGKGYALCTSLTSANTQNSKAKILKVVLPKWEEKSDTVFKILPHKNVILKDAAFSIKFAPIERRCIGQNPTNCFCIVLVEVPEEHRNTIYIKGDFEVMKVHQLVRTVSLEFVDADSVKIEPQFIKLGLEESNIAYFKDNENDIVYVKLKSGASWGDDWREYLCGGNTRGLSIRDVCLALKEKGYYSGPETIDKLTPSLKDALIRFQKDNRLPVGSLDYETLKVLFPPPLAVWSEQEKLMYSLNDEEPPKYRRGRW